MQQATAQVLEPALSAEDLLSHLYLVQKKADAGPQFPCLETKPDKPTSACACGSEDNQQRGSEAFPCMCNELHNHFAPRAFAASIAFSLLQRLHAEPLLRKSTRFSMAIFMCIVFVAVAMLALTKCRQSPVGAGRKSKASKLRALVKGVEQQQTLEERNNWLSATVKYALHNFESAKFGLDVSIGSVSIDSESGRVDLTDVSLKNLQGYKLACSLMLSQIRLAIDMERLIASRGEDVRINEVVVDDVTIHVEQAGGSTNIADIMAILINVDHFSHLNADNNNLPRCMSVFSELKGDGSDNFQDKANPPGPPQILVRRVEVRRVVAKAAGRILEKVGSIIPVPGIVYDDFDRDVASAWQADKRDVDVIIVPFFIMLVLICLRYNVLDTTVCLWNGV